MVLARRPSSPRASAARSRRFLFRPPLTLQTRIRAPSSLAGLALSTPHSDLAPARFSARIVAPRSMPPLSFHPFRFVAVGAFPTALGSSREWRAARTWPPSGGRSGSPESPLPPPFSSSCPCMAVYPFFILLLPHRRLSASAPVHPPFRPPPPRYRARPSSFPRRSTPAGEGSGRLPPALRFPFPLPRSAPRRAVSDARTVYTH